MHKKALKQKVSSWGNLCCILRAAACWISTLDFFGTVAYNIHKTTHLKDKGYP